jgi:hypothetical protein
MMKKRGPKSAAERDVTLPNPKVIEVVSRPDAPYDLTDEQAQEWWAVVNRLPADWFPRETHGMLVQYCRHVVSARRVAQLLTQAEAAKRLDLARYNQLLIMQEREGRALSSLATRMRISQQATVPTPRAHKPDWVDNPWDYGR